MPDNLFDQLRGAVAGKDGRQSTRPSNERSVVLSGASHGRYEAFGTTPKGTTLRRLGIRPIEEERARERVLYSQLLRIGEDGTKGRALTLMYPFMIVIVRGHHLQPVADAIDQEVCVFIQQFDPKRWAIPTDEEAPFISSMEFFYPKR